MSEPQETFKPSAALTRRLARLFARETPEDQAAVEALHRIEQMQERIERVREDVKRGVRSSEERFRL